jgi:hypothetical protein
MSVAGRVCGRRAAGVSFILSYEESMYENNTNEPWKLAANRVHDYRDGDSWVVTVFANEAPSGSKIVAEIRGASRQQAVERALLAAAAPALLAACQYVADLTGTAIGLEAAATLRKRCRAAIALTESNHV